MYIESGLVVVAVQAIIIIINTGHKTKTKKIYKIQLERCFV